jgi:hypothetical protein
MLAQAIGLTFHSLGRGVTVCCGPGQGFTRLWMARGRFRCWLGHARQVFCRRPTAQRT